MRWRALVAALAVSAAAHAEDRVATDLALSPELLATKGRGDGHVGFGGRGHFLATAGAYARLFPGDHPMAAVGVDARPLFLPRWLKNQESDRSFWELTIDSLHLSLGGRFERHARASFEIGGGVEAPLFGRYHGPYVGVEALYWARHGALVGGDGGEWTGLLSVGWRFGVISHVVDANDRR